MRHWLQLATRNWQAKATRTLGAIAAIAIGTAAVVWVTSCYESVRRTVLAWATGYVGSSHITVQSPLGKYDQVPERLIEALAKVDGVKVANGTLVQRLRALPLRRGQIGQVGFDNRQYDAGTPEIDFHGVNLDTELSVRDHAAHLVAGRFLTDADKQACVLDASFAEDARISVGDFLFVWGGAQEAPVGLEIVGLVKRKRIARFQKGLAFVLLPTLQQINSKAALVTSIDIVVADASAENVQKVFNELRMTVKRIAPTAVARSVEGRMRQIEFAQSQQEFVLLVLSCIVMLTALVTILSTLSMGMIERIGQLGLMRCVGVTGGQLAWLMLLEILPLGVLGVLAGVPLGLAMTAATVWFVPEYVGEFTVNVRGVTMAVAAGLATTLLAAIVPMLAAVTVSPMEAARPRARSPHRWALLGALALAVGALAVQQVGLMDRLERSTQFFRGAAVAIVLLYVGYALAAPVVVSLVGAPAVWAAAGALRVRARLLAEQVGHAVWRSAGVCCGLMVGLSLIVGIVVVNESVTTGWQFPKRFPAAYVWGLEQMRADAFKVVRDTPGVGRFTVASATNAVVQERRPMFMEQVLLSVTWFVGCDPESFFDMIRVEMVEGTQAEAIRLLSQGGHIVVADDFARSRDKHLGDDVTVYIGDRAQKFRIAGVIRSPALDIAAGYFQAHNEFNVVASGSVMGSRADVKKFFGIDGVRLVLLDFDLPPEPPPPGWPPPRGTPDADGLSDRLYDANVPLARRWQSQRENEVLRNLRNRLGAPQASIGTASELKDEIDKQLTEMTRLVTAVPTVALIVAALGVANLMTANVTARARQIAVLRAVGATRGLILRMVIGEALVLGLLGSAMGVALGLHLATNVTTLVERMWGLRLVMEMPWLTLAVAIALTVGLCILAGVLPARHAARTNIVEALRVA